MIAYIYLSIAFCGAVLILCRKRFRDGRMGVDFPVFAGLILLAALSLRLYLGYNSEGFSTDMNTFKGWGLTLGKVGFGEIYQQDMFLDYPPGYLYVLMILEKLRQSMKLAWEGQAYTLVMKLPSIIADLACGAVLLWLGRKKLGDRSALVISAAYLFCPAVFVNSAQWGQADSFCTAVLLASVLLLYGEMYVFSGLLYGLAVICKPQMLVFAPLYIFFAVKRRKWLGLGLGVGCALLAIILAATPFTQNFDYWWLVQKYQSTMDYYNYYTVNACNYWALFRMNWRALPDGIVSAILTAAAPVLATAACGWLVLGSKRKDAVFAAAPLLMGIVYIFAVKMHERYLFPAFLFLLVAYIFVRDKRLMRAYAYMAAANYLNVSYQLWIFREKGNGYDPNAFPYQAIAFLQIAALGYLLWTLYRVYLNGDVREPDQPVGKEPKASVKTAKKPAREAAHPLLQEQAPDAVLLPVRCGMTKLDWVLMVGITVIYGFVGFWNLGGAVMPMSNWTPSEGESVVLHSEQTCHTLYYMPGLAADFDFYKSKWGANIHVESSEDGVHWEDCGTFEDKGNSHVFAWYLKNLETPGSYVRLTAMDDHVVISEASISPILTKPVGVTAQGPGAEFLVDEPDTVPLYKTYMNSSYFDEIYHARTAYEHILGLEPYENTHPPLGKQIISLGIRIFGMNPFGWRFMGALFGVLMLPALYHLCKNLFGKTWLCGLGTVLFAFDFMHFTQTRIATIDTYSVFFLLLMYDAMVCFLHKDLVRASMKELLLPLGLSGIFMGLGVASKWTAAYGAVGLAVLFFAKLVVSCRQEPKGRPSRAAVWKRCWQLCLWCCLLFIAIPFGIYFAAFLPMTTLPHNVDRLMWAFWNYQTTMFNYHSQLVATHSFSSPWYDWPLDARPIWFFSSDPADAAGHYSTIVSMGNPLLWWSGLAALAFSVWEWFKKRALPSGVALVGFLSVYLPWVLVPRLTFIYHYFTAVPFLALALLAVFNWLSEGPWRKEVWRRQLAVGKWEVELELAPLVMAGMAAACIVLFAVYFPAISGLPTTRDYVHSLMLFDSWYFG